VKFFGTAKTADVFFSGGVDTRPLREAGLRALAALQKEGFRVDIATQRLPQEEFCRRCAGAYIVWCPPGFGWDCYRTYEAALAGSVPCMTYPVIQRHTPLREGEHALYYGIEGDHLQTVLREALRNKERLAEMGHAAREHMIRHHTFSALADYVVREAMAARESVA
jgi:hypothetical protein